MPNRALIRTRATLGLTVAVTLATPSAAQRLMELEGIELRGSARVVAYGAATCEIREGFAGDDKAYDPANHGQALDVWQLDFSVYNGSGKWLDHLIARYNIASEWPPCSSWDGPQAGTVEGSVEWADKSGHIQETGRNVVEPGQTLTATTYLVVFHSDEPPRFERWSMDYDFAASPPANGGASSASVRPPAPVPGESAAATFGAFDPGQTCVGKAVGASCWIEIENHPGCYVWNGELSKDETATWSGDCAEGLAQGSASLKWSWTDGDGNSASATGMGGVRDGKMTGQWTERFSDGDVGEGPYVDGKRHGRWTVRFANGNVSEGPYVDGKPNGRWTARGADGHVEEGPFVDGKRNGHWTERDADGDVGEGPYVDGKRDGRWTETTVLRGTRRTSGGARPFTVRKVWQGTYENGTKHGHWIGRGSDGSLMEGAYANGQRSGHWIEREPDGEVYEGAYANGRRYGRWTLERGGAKAEGLWIDQDSACQRIVFDFPNLQIERLEGKGC